MHYVTADIHGWKNKYDALLSAINLKSNDKLYIVGDAIDRGPDGVEILLDVMARPNVEMLMGNHERMCLDALDASADDRAWGLWEYNGGAVTETALRRLERRDPGRFDTLVAFLKSLPVERNLSVDNQTFYLVHAFPDPDDEEKLWRRPRWDDDPGRPGETVIVGHTPVENLAPRDAVDAMLRDRGHVAIYHAPRFVAIDCGGAYPSKRTRLACLRLEDGREFYV